MQRELITFEVEDQSFGIDIMAVREIRAWTPATRLPRVPHYMAGVVNLRGTVLPVVDLAALLGWQATEATPRHAIIVAQIDGQARGFIVHSVSDIVTADASKIQPVPSTAEGGIGAFLEGLVEIDDRMVMILALDSLREAGEALAA